MLDLTWCEVLRSGSYILTCRQEGIRCVYIPETNSQPNTSTMYHSHIFRDFKCTTVVGSVGFRFFVGFGCVHLIIKRNSQPTTTSCTCWAPNLKERYKSSPSRMLHSLGCQRHNITLCSKLVLTFSKEYQTGVCWFDALSKAKVALSLNFTSAIFKLFG